MSTQIDMSDFCTSERMPSTAPSSSAASAALHPRRQVHHHPTRQPKPRQMLPPRHGNTHYDQPQNGYVAEDGTITSWPEIADGTYTVQAWNGTGVAVTEQQLTGRRQNRNVARTSFASLTRTPQTYKVQSLSFNEEGNIDVEAIHWPTDAAGNVGTVSDGT